MHIASRHTFHCHLLATPMHLQHMCLNTAESCTVCFHSGFSQACLASTVAREAFKFPWQADSQL